MAPMVTNGDRVANGTNDDPLEKITVHWSYDGDNGTNGDNNVINGVIDTIGINESNGTNGSPMVIIGAIDTNGSMAPMDPLYWIQ